MHSSTMVDDGWCVLHGLTVAWLPNSYEAMRRSLPSRRILTAMPSSSSTTEISRMSMWLWLEKIWETWVHPKMENVFFDIYIYIYIWRASPKPTSWWIRMFFQIFLESRWELRKKGTEELRFRQKRPNEDMTESTPEIWKHDHFCKACLWATSQIYLECTY